MDPISIGLGLIKDLIGLFPSAEQRANALQKIQEAELAVATAQLQVNAEEAKTGSLFIGGWRPFVGWTCAAGFAYVIMLQPLMAWLCAGLGIVTPPIPNSEVLFSALFGLLGLGGMRSFEKVKGVTR